MSNARIKSLRSLRSKKLFIEGISEGIVALTLIPE